MRRVGGGTTKEQITELVGKNMDRKETIVVSHSILASGIEYWDVLVTDLAVEEVEPTLKGEPSPYAAHGQANG